MILKNIEILNFRNIEHEQIIFDGSVNLLFGQNGQGKTSILEAIYLLCLTKSFKAKTEKVFLQYNKDFLDIKGNFFTDNSIETSTRFFYSPNDGKHVFLNSNKIDKFSEIIGFVPIVILSLEDLEIAYGVPAVRRRFIDILLSQVSPLYLQALQQYKKSLLHRNKVLTLIKNKEENESSLYPWDKQIIKHGSEIAYSRKKFLNYLDKKLADYYHIISDKNDTINVTYQSNVINREKEEELKEIKESFSELLDQKKKEDIERETTSIGPHRDDFKFYINNHLIKSFGSQGENKTLLIALKFVESDYLKEKKKDNPILLLDDIFGELDEYRISHLMDSIFEIGQTFITTTLKDKFRNSRLKASNFFEIQNGVVLQ